MPQNVIAFSYPLHSYDIAMWYGIPLVHPCSPCITIFRLVLPDMTILEYIFIVLQCDIPPYFVEFLEGILVYIVLSLIQPGLIFYCLYVLV